MLAWLFWGCSAGSPGGETDETPVAIVATATPDHGPVPLTVDLSATADAPGSAVWTFDDGTTATGETLEHLFLSAGMHTATATWTTSDGRTGTADAVIDADPERCPDLGEGQLLGTVHPAGSSEPDALLNEVSGVAASRKNPGVLWIHEDKNNPADLYAVDSAGNELATLEIVGADKIDDTEDIAIGVDPTTGEDRIYLSDTGDNDWNTADARESVAIYGLPEPTVTLGQPKAFGTIVIAEQMTLTYPDYPRDAEALGADPVTGDLFLFTKNPDGSTWVFRKAAPHVDGQEAVLEQVGFVEFEGPVTAADISPLGDQIALRDYSKNGLIWLRDGSQTVADAMAGEPCEVTMPSMPGAEALAYSPDGTGIFFTHERSPEIFWAALEPGK
jgi:hypothetical protein